MLQDRYKGTQQVKHADSVLNYPSHQQQGNLKFLETLIKFRILVQ